MRLHEIPRRVAIPCEDRRAVPVLVHIDHLDCIFVFVCAYHRQHGAKNFLLVDRHVGCDVVEEASADEETVLVSLQIDITTIDDAVWHLP